MGTYRIGVNPKGLEPDNSNKLVIEVSRKGFTDETLNNLKMLIADKEKQIRTALGAVDLSFEITKDRLRFPWFTLTGTETEIAAFVCMIYTLCDLAKKGISGTLVYSGKRRKKSENSLH